MRHSRGAVRAACLTATMLAIATAAGAPPLSAQACAPTGPGACRYVDAANGDDAGAGTSSAPYRTLQRAADVAGPGDVVVVRDGMYTGSRLILEIVRSGTGSAPITFRAEHRWGAVLDGRHGTSAIGIEVRGRYVRVEGFEVRGTSRYGIEAYGGANVTVAGNHVHDIGRICTSSPGGIVGINAYVPDLTIEGNVVHDIGRLANGEEGCVTTNSYWQNHDHGIYQGQGDNLLVRNNVFYGMTRGWAIQRYSGERTVVANLRIVNNTFVGSNPNKDGQIVIASPVAGLVIANNIFFQPRGAAVFFDEPGTVAGTMSNNLVVGADLAIGSHTGVTEAGTVSADPRFVDAAAHDYRLQPGSPAIAAGLALPMVLDDLLGVPRPQDARPDIGAYQHR